MNYNPNKRKSKSLKTLEKNDYNPNFFIENQIDNIHEEIYIPEAYLEDNQSEPNFNFINDMNVNNEEYINDSLQISNQNFNSHQNLNIQANPYQICIFPEKKYESTQRDYQKRFLNFLTKYGDNLIQSVKLPKKLKKIKLHKPNPSFILNTKKSDNLKFLSITVQDIFCNIKTGVSLKKNSPKKKNKILIDAILDYGDEEKFEKLKMFFRMTLEEAYKLFEESEDFKKYSMKQKTVFLDKKCKTKNDFSLLEKTEFIKQIKICNNIND